MKILLLILFLWFDLLCFSQNSNKSVTFEDDVTYTGFYDETGVSQLKGLRWEFNIDSLDQVFHNVCVVDSIVISTTFCECTEKNYLFANNLNTGKLIWSKQVESFLFGYNIVTTGKYVALIDENNTLEVNEIATGKTKWTYKNEAEVSTQPIFFDDLIVFGRKDSVIIGIDIKNNKEALTINMNGVPFGDISKQSNDLYVYTIEDSMIYLNTFELLSKKMIWKTKIASESPERIYYSLIVGKDYMINYSPVTIYENQLIIHSHRDNIGATIDRRYHDSISTIMTINRKDGKILWKKQFKNCDASYTLYGGRLYYLGQNCINGMDICAIELKNGKIIREKVIDTKTDNEWGGAIVNDGKNLYFNDRRCFYAMNMKDLNFLWKYDLDYMYNQKPVIKGHKVIIANYTKLIVLE